MQFPLFKDHIQLAHHYWNLFLQSGDTVIDSTCGNGHDSLFLAKKILTDSKTGKLYLIDLQETAILNTEKLLNAHLSSEQMQHVHFLHASHAIFPDSIFPSSVSLIVYNLGYLPGGDKSFTTSTTSTLESIKNATSLIKPGGVISIT